jgi:AraC-like DNA-binding protein
LGHADDPTVPAAHALYLLDFVKRWNVGADDLFSGSGVSPSSLTDPQERLRLSVLTRLIDRARTLTGEPALGFLVGAQARISMHGYLGFAALSAGTMREAIEIAIQYVPILTTAVGLRMRVEGRTASIILDERADFGSARDVILPAVLVGIWQIGKALTGHDLRDGYIDFAFPEPPYSDRIRTISRRVRFGQATNRLLFRASVLNLPYTMGDPVALRLAKEQCERELNSLGLDGRVVGRVQRLMSKSEGGFRSLEEVAGEMHLSPRTLKRRLASEGLSYSTLLEQERHERALLLLRSPDLSIAQVVSRLGYANAANFARAFRRWSGRTPAEYRRDGDAREKGGR